MLMFMLHCDNDQKLWLMVDRTNWKFGKTHHNLLVISAQIGDTAIPLIWRSLDKAGASNTKERIELMQKLLRFFPKERVIGLLADREFIGEEWLEWLQKQGIPFVTRLKENMVVQLEDGGTITLKKLFSRVKQGFAAKPKKVVLGKKLRVFVQAKRTCKGLVIVTFDGNFGEDAPQPVNTYRKRWLIECGFACLKRKAFELEDTHLIHANRLETLLGVVAIAFAWSLKIGQKLPKPKRKNHGYNANCLFTIGKKHLIHALQNTEKIIILMAYAFNLCIVKKGVV